VAVVERPLIRAAVVLPILFGLQVSVAAEIRPFGVAGDLFLACAITAGLLGGPVRGARYGFGLGLLTDLVTRLPFGMGALTGALVAYFVGLVPVGAQSTRRAYVTVVAVATAAASLFASVLAILFGRDDLAGSGLVRITLVMALLHAVVALPLRALGRFVLLPDVIDRH